MSATQATLFDTGSNTAGPAVLTDGTGGLGVAIAPDGRTAYVVDAGATGPTGQVSVVDLTASPPVTTGSIDIPSRPGNFIAISPDGRKAYMTDPRDGLVFPIDLTSAPASVGTGINVGGNPEGIAFTPDGTKAYVAENANTGGPPEVLPITVSSDSVGAPITSLGPHPFAIAITPNGATAYVTDAGSGADGKVYPIDLASNTAGSGIMIGGSLFGIAIIPDGSRAYVTGPTPSSVTPISLPANQPGTAIVLTGNPAALAITPDGKTAYVTDGNNSGTTVTPIAVASNTPGSVISGFGGPSRGIAIVPDQAPVANFTVSSASPGSPTTFDASGSTVRFGTITRYDWNFGDGTALPDGGPTPSHVYASTGNYTATVTETDSAGTSTTGEVYTGQSASRVGSPSAQTGRSVLITAAPAPAVSLSANSLSLGTLGVGSASSPQTLTITNTGNAPLQITSSAISGAQAGDYRLSADHCTGQTIAAGAGCSTAITFTPHADGTRTAQIAFTDNASGSPHTINLTGTGISVGILSGTVTDGTRAGQPPVAGANVVVCSPANSPGATVCHNNYTDGHGRYIFPGLAPGHWGLEVYPPAGPLSGASTNLTVVLGPQTHDFVLHDPTPLPAGVTVSGADTHGGYAVTYPGQPYTVSIPTDIDPEGPPNETIVNFFTYALTADGGSGVSTNPMINGAVVMFGVRYDKNGDIAGVSPFISSPIDANAYNAALGPRAATDKLPATRDRLLAAAEPIARTACEDGQLHIPEIHLDTDMNGHMVLHGTTILGQEAPPIQLPNPIEMPETYNGNPLSAPLQAGGNAALGGIGPVSIYNNLINGANAASLAIQGNNQQLGKVVFDIAGDKLGDKIAGEAYHGWEKMIWGYDKESLKQLAFPGGPSGPENSCKVPSPSPKHGKNKGGNSKGGGQKYNDPSGVVETLGGIPIAGARVVLLRAGSKSAPLHRVPNGSATMSPANRRNPDFTNPFGRFAWDTLTGFYAVTAQKSGCTAPGKAHRRIVTTRRFPVPPPVANLVLRLSCPHAQRDGATITLQVRTGPRNGNRRSYELVAKVRRRRGHQAALGSVSFRAGRRELAVVAVDVRSGAALVNVVLPAHRARIVAIYSGNAFLKPSTSAAR